MRVIGITGGTGSGKSVVTAMLAKRGAFVVDADAISHQVIRKGEAAYDNLVAAFGREILDEQGEIARKKLGAKVFQGGPALVERLNQCTHPVIFQRIQQDLAKAQTEGFALAVVDAPLLLEEPFSSLCKEIWVVSAKEEVRLGRIMARDGIDKDHAMGRIRAQRDWESYCKTAPVVIDNSTTVEDVERQVAILLGEKESGEHNASQNNE